jgi:hypothetical protein
MRMMLFLITRQYRAITFVRGASHYGLVILVGEEEDSFQGLVHMAFLDLQVERYGHGAVVPILNRGGVIIVGMGKVQFVRGDLDVLGQ